MDMNFAIGLYEGIAWPWPIAVYLFLAGISGGAVAAAVILNLYRKRAHENTPVLKAASVIGAGTILGSAWSASCSTSRTPSTSGAFSSTTTPRP